MNKPEFEYDIGLSFASEQRGYVDLYAGLTPTSFVGPWLPLRIRRK